MHVIYVGKGQQAMQRRIDRRRAAVEVKRAMRQEFNHVVFMVYAPVKRLETQDAIEVQSGKAIELHRP